MQPTNPSIHNFANQSEQVSNKKAKLKTQVQRNQLLADVVLRIYTSLSLDEILNTTVTEVRQLLQVERVIIYRFDPNGGGKITVESVVTTELSILDQIIPHKYFQRNWLDSHHNKVSQSIANIYQSNLNPDHIELLTQYQIKACLLVPILVENSPWGLLIAHSCSDVRPWEADEVEFPLVAEYLNENYKSSQKLIIPVANNPHAEAVLAQDRAIVISDIETEYFAGRR